MMKVLIYLLIINFYGYGIMFPYPIEKREQCKVPDSVLNIIHERERAKQRKKGYAYIIQFNNKKDLEKVNILLDYFPHEKINSRVIDCKSKKNCVKLIKYLEINKILNIDLGTHQVNYYFHRYKNINLYFDFTDSETIACNYLHSLVNKYGWNWYAIAAYHSRTKKYNLAYQKHIKKSYLKNNIQN